MKKEMASQGPPGYEPDPTPKPKTKAAKRNERKKEKRLEVCVSQLYPYVNYQLRLRLLEHASKLLSSLQAAAEKGNSSEDGSSNVDKEEAVPIVTPSSGPQSVDVLVSSLDALNLGEAHNQGTAGEDIEKRIRALKKKVRLSVLSFTTSLWQFGVIVSF